MTACSWWSLECICGRFRVCTALGLENAPRCPVCGGPAILSILLTKRAETSRTLPYSVREAGGVLSWIHPPSYSQPGTELPLTAKERPAQHSRASVTCAVAK